MDSQRTDTLDDSEQDFIEITDRLDLHGFFPEQIPEIIEAFISNAEERGLTDLRVIHGKGRSRLKFEVLRCLKHDDRVLGFKDAPPSLGGWGATQIQLKSK